MKTLVYIYDIKTCVKYNRYIAELLKIPKENNLFKNNILNRLL